MSRYVADLLTIGSSDRFRKSRKSPALLVTNVTGSSKPSCAARLAWYSLLRAARSTFGRPGNQRVPMIAHNPSKVSLLTSSAYARWVSSLTDGFTCARLWRRCHTAVTLERSYRCPSDQSTVPTSPPLPYSTEICSWDGKLLTANQSGEIPRAASLGSTKGTWASSFSLRITIIAVVLISKALGSAEEAKKARHVVRPSLG